MCVFVRIAENADIYMKKGLYKSNILPESPLYENNCKYIGCCVFSELAKQKYF